MKKIFILFVIGLFMSCTKGKQNIALDVLSKYSEVLKSDQSLKKWSYGGVYTNSIDTVELTYTCDRELSIHQVRELLVKDINKLLYELNNNVELRQKLIQYPMTVNEIEFMVIFTKPNTDIIVTDGYISLGTVFNGKIKYSTLNPFTKRDDTIHSESFQEAEEILRNSNRCVPAL